MLIVEIYTVRNFVNDLFCTLLFRVSDLKIGWQILIINQSQYPDIWLCQSVADYQTRHDTTIERS